MNKGLNPPVEQQQCQLVSAAILHEKPVTTKQD